MAGPKRPNLISVTTINQDGSRHFLYPADVRGKWTKLRKWVALVLMLIYIIVPWIEVGGHPAVFLDVERCSFHLLGYALPTQDLWLFFFGMLGLGFALFVITSLLGRLWCGWACPYTVFLDHIYRRIERWVEGDATARKALHAAAWSPSKVGKRLLKHGLYAVVSWLIAHIFLSYFVSLPRLYQFMQDGPLEHATAFGMVMALTGVLWFCFGYFREQFCIVMCPYGRLQSALTDDDTINVGYDVARGEPRGAKGKTTGDCVDCNRCVQVCPTGIDIRNGLQMECIGCTACIDACDEVMTRIGRPTGLVRYDSYNAFLGKKHRWLRPRIYLYAVLITLGLSLFGLMATWKLRPFYINVMQAGSAGPSVDASGVRNVYKIQLINKRSQRVDMTVRLTGQSPSGYRIAGGDLHCALEPGQELNRNFIVEVPLSDYRGTTHLQLEAKTAQSESTMEKTFTFRGPPLHSIKRTP